jgi:hypothetical protein
VRDDTFPIRLLFSVTQRDTTIPRHGMHFVCYVGGCLLQSLLLLSDTIGAAATLVFSAVFTFDQQVTHNPHQLSFRICARQWSSFSGAIISSVERSCTSALSSRHAGRWLTSSLVAGMLTSESHVFCTQCADVTGLSSSQKAHRACPACSNTLPNPDDVVVTGLNPSEDYKTSVLSGLSPTIIMECASRGLAFHNYQTVQETIYQEHLAKGLTEKYNTLSQQMDQLILDANSQIKILQDKTQGLTHLKRRLANGCH